MSDRIIKAEEGRYLFDGNSYSIPKLLDAIREADDKEGGKYYLSDEESKALSSRLSSYNNFPSFSNVAFMAASSALFKYLATNHDPSLLAAVAKALGWKSDEEKMKEIKSFGASSALYKEWWMEYAKALLTSDGFDDFHFGRITSDRDGCYLYDDEKAVLYVEVSRDGSERRNAVLSLTLLGNPEAVVDEEQNREFEWCCYFDDLISEDEEGTMLLGGHLRTIDPYGESSRLMRRYDLVYKALLPSELALVTKELIHLLSLYPPEN